jgi:hypothetical protein
MTRYRHFVQRVTGGRFPKKIILLDCEGKDNGQHETTGRNAAVLGRLVASAWSKSGSTYHRRHWAEFVCVDSFWKYLETECNQGGVTWVVSYRNNRIWSLLNMWGEIENGRIRLVGNDYRCGREQRPPGKYAPEGYLVIEDPPNIARFRLGKACGWVQWVDVRNYGVDLPISLESGHATVSALAEFVFGMIDAIKAYSLGSLCATAGSQALHGFKAGYLIHGIYCHDNRRAAAIESKSYYGGRCEPYEIGVTRSDLYHLDFRSLYPAVCRDTKLPCRLLCVNENPGQQESEALCEQQRIIADVDIETSEPAYPYRRACANVGEHRQKGSANSWYPSNEGTDIIYPIGRFRTTLAGPELLDALEHGRIRKWHSYTEYGMDYAIREYAIQLHALRSTMEQGNNPSLRQWIKRMLVALPGKFSQHDRRWITLPNEMAPMPFGEWFGQDISGAPCRYRSIGNVVQRDSIGDYAHDANVALASWITSAGRQRLLAAIRITSWEQVYYVDTDALIVSHVGFIRLQQRGMVRCKELGYLDIKSGPSEVTIHGIKHYIENGNITCAGLPKGYGRRISGNNLYEFSENPARQIKHGIRPNGTEQVRSYICSDVYHHAIVQSNGTVTPHILEEW